MEKKLTAIEWLKKELEEYGSPDSLKIDWQTLDELIEQAKAMEKVQILNAWHIGVCAMDNSTAEQYYTQSYEGGE